MTPEVYIDFINKFSLSRGPDLTNSYFDKESNKMSNLKSNVIKKVEENEFTWNELITGFNNKKIKLMSSKFQNINPN